MIAIKELSGLDLREAVAVEVIRCEHKSYSPSRAGGSYDHECGPVEFCHDCGGVLHWGGQTVAEYPAYESSIRAAWEVVEAMRARGYMVSIQGASAPSAAGKRWGAFFDSAALAPSGAVMERVPYGESAPDVICRAALAAMRAA